MRIRINTFPLTLDNFVLYEDSSCRKYRNLIPELPKPAIASAYIREALELFGAKFNNENTSAYFLNFNFSFNSYHPNCVFVSTNDGSDGVYINGNTVDEILYRVINRMRIVLNKDKKTWKNL